ncbi:MAG TPA: peptidoglycan bridge formation glycyltransferase FemA/FemB family protein [Flexilinea sp.]|nr:peptidoglycan bridge formation glycyltransferase FemA/FemB family protein [Flexilinea sp.]
MNTVTTLIAPDHWNEEIASLPGASILQTSQWAEIKSSGGWTPLFQKWLSADGQLRAAALILRKKIFLQYEFWYIPRGPLLDWEDSQLRTRVLDDLQSLAKKGHAVFIKMDPDVPTGFGVPGTNSYQEQTAGQLLLSEYKKRGWVHSPQQIQFANSVWIDLSPSEEDLLMNMKQRTRYKVRLAEKKGVTVRHGTCTDFENLYAMYAETSERDQFIIREKAYYLNVWNRFYDTGMLTPLIAETEGQAIAALMLFTYAQRSWYIYGMSTDRHREKMPNYLLQWEAIKTAKQAGSRIYDLWGAPDIYDESDRMWGVYQFKQGFGGFEVNTPGAWDLPLHKTGYHLFVRTLPAFLAYLKRKK